MLAYLSKDLNPLGIKIRESLQGRKQRWLVLQMIKMGVEMTEVRLSNKLHGVSTFTTKEIEAIEKILGTKY